MINIYVNGRKCSKMKEEELKSKFSEIDDIKFFRWKESSNPDHSEISVYFLSPTSYSSKYVSHILKSTIDNPKNVILIVDKFDYNENKDLISYKKDQKHELESIKYAFLLEGEGYFNSIFTAVKYINKINKK